MTLEATKREMDRRHAQERATAMTSLMIRHAGNTGQAAHAWGQERRAFIRSFQVVTGQTPGQYWKAKLAEFFEERGL